MSTKTWQRATDLVTMLPDHIQRQQPGRSPAMMRKSRPLPAVVFGLGLAVVVLVSPACVVEPIDGTGLGTTSTPFDVIGFASAPAATLRIEAFHWNTGTWQQIVTATSASSTSNSGRPLYIFSVGNLSLPNQYWQLGCGSNAAKLRVREDGLSTPSSLVTFDQSASNCLFDNIGAGEPWFDAGLACFSGTEIRLFTPAPPC